MTRRVISDYNCLLQGPTFFLADTVQNYFFWPNKTSYHRRDSLILTGNNDLTEPNGISIMLLFKHIHYLTTGLEGPHDIKLPFEIFPNPANNHVIIRNNQDEPFLYMIYDSLGNLKYQSKELNTSELMINLDSYNPGLYSVLITTKNNSKTYKLLKI